IHSISILILSFSGPREARAECTRRRIEGNLLSQILWFWITKNLEFHEFPINQIRVSEYPEAGLSPNFIYELP
ncbi:unnamed protein product, partial [Linum tenue]